ncbi:unnamed protein product [Caenorhabditis angaria]|uniref:HotDog ACOT-type domain-containing protein n=1 Tax=Caenorhabditis angaria TaxID=860376 RepID=A0A9P1NC52_9PELO|nr:unnamed protein product [Caenorhabditis angaria]
MNQTANSVSALRNKGMMLRQMKRYKPKSLQKALETQAPTLRTMDQLYDCFYEYSRNLMVPKTPIPTTINLEKREQNQSELRIILPLATDSAARLKIADSEGHIRIGRLLEAVDIVAPCSCYMLNRSDLESKWFAEGTLPRMFVTSKIHQISLNDAYRISPYHDLYLTGKVTWTGENHSEATVSVQQNGNTMLTAKLVFASLNAQNTTQKYAVNQLSPTTSYETELLNRRQKVNTTKAITPELLALEKPEVKDGEITMSSTALETVLVAHPENENPYGSVFGGFLVRQGIETAELCAKLFAKSDVRAISLDSAEFLKVIEIGSVLKFNSYVCNVSGNIVQVCSQAEVYNEATHKFEVCDRFLFSFEAENPSKCVLPQVVPHNMQEFVAQWKAKNTPKI